MEEQIKGTTKLLALLGHPVHHSLSPEMMNYACRLLGLDYAYLAFDITEETFPEALSAVKTLGIRGCNVTMPCKRKAYECADRLSPAARITEACNTLINDSGIITGHITDGTGYVAMLQDHGIDIRGRKICVAGAGGAATAIQVQAALDGARAVTILQRKSATYERALVTASRIEQACPGCTVTVCDPSDRDRMRQELSDSDIFANGTSVGMKPAEDRTILEDLTMLHPGMVVTDAVYDPVRTRLLREAEAAGCRTIDGRGMLLWQGVAAFRLFTGQDMPVEAVRSRFFS